MGLTPSATFLIHLVQDVSILRPLVIMASRDFGYETLLLVSTKFIARDVTGIWRNELIQISEETRSRLELFSDEWEAVAHLTGYGLLFAASESHLPQHATAHNVFRVAPPGYLKVTLQHGFECVGFRHSVDHARAHGKTASFGADIICSWSGGDQLESIAASQRSKLVVTGPTAVLQLPKGPFEHEPGAPGLVCENLHSVRFNGSADHRTEFVDTFVEFCRLLAKRKRQVTLRTHPGGQYVLRNRIPLGSNCEVQNAPIYRMDLRRFSYGVSAPSTILIEMLLADIPTAVWRDRHGGIDAGNYEGLATVSSAREWLEFAVAAESDPGQFLSRQKGFLEATGMPLDPREVFYRFAELFQSARRMEVRAPGSVAERERILLVANSNIPTLQLSFEKPLAPLVGRGEVVTRLLTEQDFRAQGDPLKDSDAPGVLDGFLNRYSPSVIVFCRYSGPGYERVLDWARREQVPVIYHVDDDLLGVPRDVGERKFEIHNAPERRAAVAELLNSADLVYASTDRLKARLHDYFPDLPIVAGEIYCSSSVLRRPNVSADCKVGYMASADHAHNLAMVLPAIEKLLERNVHVRFELFGSIPVPDRLHRFGERISTAPPVRNYGSFLKEFSESRWAIGICPLSPIGFNLMKANTKWVEYTAVGAAVVASRGTVYDDCCADGCGILADTVEEWFSALDLLVNDADKRLAMVERAQAKLEHDYGVARLREQVLDVISRAHGAVRARRSDDRTEEEVSVCQVR
jgi:glycosyltransferase involved in cell wall biosynthesis